MAIKPFNSVGGYSVGPNLTPFLDADNNANVANLTVNGTANLANVSLSGNIVADNITANATLTGANLVVSNAGNITGTLFVGGNVTANANLSVTTNANIGGTANVVGAATFGSTVGVTGVLTTTTHANVGGDLNVTGAADVTGTFNADGVATFGANVDVTGNLSVDVDATITGTLEAGATTINGNLAISNAVGTNGILTDHLYYSNGSPWDLQQAAGSNTQIQFNNDGDFGASANFTFDTVTNQLTVTGSANVTADFEVGNALTVTGESIFGEMVTVSSGDLTVNDGLTVHGNVIMDADVLGGGTIAIGQTGANATDVTIAGASVDLGAVANLHVSGGSNGQYLQTNGSGNLVWATVDTSTLVNGSSNVDIATADGNVTIGVGGTAEVAVFTTDGANIKANLTVVDTVTAPNLSITTQANVQQLTVVGTSALEGAVTVGTVGTPADLTVNGQANVEGNINGDTNLNLLGSANIVTDLTVGGNGDVDGTFNANGAATFGSTLATVGDVTIGTALVSANLTVHGDANITGDIKFVDGNAVTLDLTSGLTTGTITANGLVTLGAIGNVKITGGTEGQVLTAGAVDGDLVWSSSPNVTQIVSGTSNVAVVAPNGNVAFGINGQANVIVISGDGTTSITSIANDVLIGGNLTVQGNVTNIDSTTLNVEDPVITEGRGANNTALTQNDGLDRGLYSYYYVGAANAGVEMGGFVGLKNSTGDFAGKYIIAKEATLADNVITSVAEYADVVVSSIVSGADTSGSTAIDLNAANVAINADGTAGVLTVSGNEVAAIVDVTVTGGNIAVAPVGNNGSSQITLTAGDGSGSTVTTIGSGFLVTNSSTPAPIVTIPDAPGRTVEFFISARDTSNSDFEGAKYLVVSDGSGAVDSTAYGTVRIGEQTQQVEVTFVENSGDLQARVAVIAGSGTWQFSTQYQIVG